jgi:hypothetical protein
LGHSPSSQLFAAPFLQILNTAPSPFDYERSSGHGILASDKQTERMTDLTYVGILLAFFAIAGLYTFACEKL